MTHGAPASDGPPEVGGTPEVGEATPPKSNVLHRLWSWFSGVPLLLKLLVLAAGAGWGLHSQFADIRDEVAEESKDIRGEMASEFKDIRENLNDQGIELRAAVNETKNKIDVLEERIAGIDDKLDLLIEWRTTLYPIPRHLVRSGAPLPNYPDRQ